MSEITLTLTELEAKLVNDFVGHFLTYDLRYAKGEIKDAAESVMVKLAAAQNRARSDPLPEHYGDHPDHWEL